MHGWEDDINRDYDAAVERDDERDAKDAERRRQEREDAERQRQERDVAGLAREPSGWVAPSPGTVAIAIGGEKGGALGGPISVSTGDVVQILEDGVYVRGKKHVTDAAPDLIRVTWTPRI